MTSKKERDRRFNLLGLPDDQVSLDSGGVCPQCDGTGKKVWKHRESENHSCGGFHHAQCAMEWGNYHNVISPAGVSVRGGAP